MEANISQFVAVTGASVDVARGLLEACSGNLDLAINMHLESRGGASSTPAVVGASGGPSGGARAVDDILSPKSYEELYGSICFINVSCFRVCEQHVLWYQTTYVIET